jgi:hypothetical protein
LNVAFHELVGIALAHEAGARLESPEGRGTTTWGAACVLAVGSHGILDALPHYYPLASWEDTIVSIVLFMVWWALVPRWMRRPLLAVCVAALLPDIADHVPDDLRKHLGIPFPPLPNLFPWHWPAGSGSWRGRSGPNWIVSLVNHGIVVAFCATAIHRNRHLLSLPWRARPPAKNPPDLVTASRS